MSQESSKILHRKNVLDTLADAVRKHPLVILKAPLGYGKTTIATELVKYLDRHAYFIPIKKGPHQPDYLWELICGHLAHEGVEGLEEIRAAGFPSDSRSMEFFLSYYTKSMKARPTLVVLDSYENAQAKEFDNLIENMVRASIPNFCILLLSRERPHLPIEDLQLKSHAVTFGRDLLALTKTETEELYALFGSDDKEAADITWELSEGWLAATLICLRGLQSAGVILPAPRIQRFLTESFFAEYDEDEQIFLLKLSILGSFSVEEAALVSKKQAASHYLRRLFDKNVLLNYHPATNSYRMLGLFQAYLQNILEEDVQDVCKSIDREDLYRRAAICLSKRGNRVEAANLMHKAGRMEDLELILEGFESPGRGICIAENPKTIADIVEDIPWEIRCKHPLGYLSFILHYMLRVDPKYAVRLLNEVKTYYSSQECIASEVKNRIEGEIHIIEITTKFNDIQAMYSLLEKACDLFQGRSQLLHDNM